jgi:phosphohistidine phosphatase
MTLSLVQHGEAFLEDVDPSRSLTEKGKEEVSRTAASLKKGRIKVDEIWHSGKLRARQTAEIIAETLGIKEVLEKEGLKPNDAVAPVADLLNQTPNSILIAGHLPFLARLSSRLLTGSENKKEIGFKPGRAVCFERSGTIWVLKREVDLWINCIRVLGLLVIILTLFLVLAMGIGIF